MSNLTLQTIAREAAEALIRNGCVKSYYVDQYGLECAPTAETVATAIYPYIRESYKAGETDQREEDSQWW